MRTTASDFEKNMLESVTECRKILEEGMPMYVHSYKNPSTTADVSFQSIQELVESLPKQTEFPLVLVRDVDQFRKDIQAKTSDAPNTYAGIPIRVNACVCEELVCLIEWYDNRELDGFPIRRQFVTRKGGIQDD